MSDGLEILVVDDEARLADLFAAWLQSEWTVDTAYDGEEALEKMSDSVEVVLLDRRMPGLSGDEVLERIRDAGYESRVVMVTAVDPDFDIIEMGFDDYLVKPVSKDELIEIVDDVADRTEYESDIQEYYALVSKKALLESEKADRELANNEEYQDLCDRVAELEARVDETVSGMSSHDDFVGAFQDLQSEH
ncbi:response regulator receiver protein [Haloterrigena turkmenica DSM 5511]|uniref:Response regulator receiver protein n=1 Tax=Haloterrigena turkmenica (strain ATCC 51198 / DSM 5511 / JCM 9101 / NCIMB 13204 / VKM B-1734 / 4k) TaxID=543526 RepID=D2RXX7_HALTV|nr:HalX domain-containing protein [Haloterrigena turkmenica]ADB59811.1 response regulator receiver protein [Haloterrigena turkmenica DSM 5511]